MEQTNNFFESISNHLKENPIFFAIFILLFGLLLLIAAIIDSEWLFKKNHSSYNLQKIEGIVNFFGRKTARIFVGFNSIILILLGAFLTYHYLTS